MFLHLRILQKGGQSSHTVGKPVRFPVLCHMADWLFHRNNVIRSFILREKSDQYFQEVTLFEADLTGERLKMNPSNQLRAFILHSSKTLPPNSREIKLNVKIFT